MQQEGRRRPAGCQILGDHDVQGVELTRAAVDVTDGVDTPAGRQRGGRGGKFDHVSYRGYRPVGTQINSVGASHPVTIRAARQGNRVKGQDPGSAQDPPSGIESTARGPQTGRMLPGKNHKWTRRWRDATRSLVLCPDCPVLPFAAREVYLAQAGWSGCTRSTQSPGPAMCAWRYRSRWLYAAILASGGAAAVPTTDRARVPVEITFWLGPRQFRDRNQLARWRARRHRLQRRQHSKLIRRISRR